MFDARLHFFRESDTTVAELPAILEVAGIDASPEAAIQYLGAKMDFASRSS